VSALTVDFQVQPVHEVAVENADDAAAIEALAAAKKVKLTRCNMWTCSALDCADGITHFYSFTPADSHEDRIPQ
jgi:hypothetical protein